MAMEHSINISWYCVRGLFHWRFKESGNTALFEERAILIKATTFDDALDKAEKEAVEYCTIDPSSNFFIESMNKFSAHEILEQELENGVELFSKRIDLQITPDQYFTRYHSEN
jgi:Domain of unknown function (DUF4288)